MRLYGWIELEELHRQILAGEVRLEVGNEMHVALLKYLEKQPEKYEWYVQMWKEQKKK